jgi:uncharacterized protein YkwD
MSDRPSRAARAAPAVLAIVLVALGLRPVPAEAECPDADSSPTTQNGGRLAVATLCLLNEQRGLRSLPALRPQPELAQAAQSYSADMVAWQFFDHVTPGGRTLVDRVRATGYLRPSGTWALGENLAWGSGQDSTPRRAVVAWMASAPHRANVLEPTFRDVGIGVAPGVPVAAAGAGATYTTDFGSRTLHRAGARARARFRWATGPARRG